MQATINYGKNGIQLDIPSEWNVTTIEKKGMTIPSDPEQAVFDALNSPVKARSLKEEADGKQSACILICDITRPVPNGLILPPLVQELLAAGMKPENITILVATGLHRPNEGEELRELVGSDWVLNTVRVENHYGSNDEDHVFISTTESGNHVKLDRRFVNAELKIVTGLVEPHFMAGYSGGRKLIAPGIAHRDTITTFHTARYLEHPKSANCVLDGNPFHGEMTGIAKMLGRILAVNTVIDENKKLSFVNYGEISESHAWAIEFMKRYAEVNVDRRFQTVITSGGGYPLDKTYYQTVKGMVSPMDIVELGGNIIILSECSEGMGSQEYVDAQKRLVQMGPDAFLQSILDKSKAGIDEWQTEMQLKPMRIAGIHLFSDKLSSADKSLTGIPCQEDGETADVFVRRIVQASGHREIAVVPEGPYIIPIFKGK